MAALPAIIALMRGLHLAATLSLLGAAGFSAWILPASRMVPNRLRRAMSRFRWISGALALLAGAAWFTLQAAAIAGADTWPDIWQALPVVAEHTRFGTMLMPRLGLIAIATLAGLTRGGLYPTIALTTIALAIQGFIGHAGATPGPAGHALLLSEALHLSAAGIWLGARRLPARGAGQPDPGRRRRPAGGGRAADATVPHTHADRSAGGPRMAPSWCAQRMALTRRPAGRDSRYPCASHPTTLWSVP